MRATAPCACSRATTRSSAPRTRTRCWRRCADCSRRGRLPAGLIGRAEHDLQRSISVLASAGTARLFEGIRHESADTELAASGRHGGAGTVRLPCIACGGATRPARRPRYGFESVLACRCRRRKRLGRALPVAAQADAFDDEEMRLLEKCIRPGIETLRLRERKPPRGWPAAEQRRTGARVVARTPRWRSPTASWRPSATRLRTIGARRCARWPASRSIARGLRRPARREGCRTCSASAGRPSAWGI